MQLESCENRLKSMLITEKQGASQKINKVLKSEVLFVFKNYFDIKAEDLTLDLSINEFGKYSIKINAEARSMKFARVFN